MRMLKTDLPLVSIVIAALAFIVSLLPYLQDAIDDPEIEVKLGPEATIYLGVENPVITSPLILYNRGNESGVVSRMNMTFGLDDGTLVVGMPRQNYVSDDIRASTNTPVAATPFGYEVIDAGVSWKRVIQSSDLSISSLDSTAFQLASDMRAEFLASNEAALAANLKSFEFAPTAELQKRYLNHLDDTYKNFVEGRYIILLQAIDQNEKIHKTVAYEFRLDAATVVKLRSIFSRYSTGSGVLGGLPFVIDPYTVQVEIKQITEMYEISGFLEMINLQ